MNELKIVYYKKEYLSKSGEVKTATNIVLTYGDFRILIKSAFDKDYTRLITLAKLVGEEIKIEKK